MSSRFAAILVAIVVIFGGIFFFTKHKATAPSQGGKAQTTQHIEGSTKTGVTLVEYADYQCPACSAYYPLVKQTVEKYKDQIQFQFVNFPLYTIHPNAMAAHRAAEAAGLQNKYWEMHDLIYTNHDVWEKSTSVTTYFEQYAQQLGLDAAKFKQDSASSKINDILWADINKGTALKVDATPTFFLDGKKITSQPASVDDFSKLIDAEIKVKAKP